MLEIRDLHVHYGGIHALKGVSLDVPQGAIVTLIGANGAGKSSTLRAIAGLIKHKRGRIAWDGTDISHLDPVGIVKTGIVMSPEGRRIFPHLTVLENLHLGAYSRSDAAGIARDLDWVFELFPRLERAPGPKGRHPVRRRAADAGRGPGADERTQAASCSTSRASAWPRFWSRRSSTSSAPSTTAA